MQFFAAAIAALLPFSAAADLVCDFPRAELGDHADWQDQSVPFKIANKSDKDLEIAGIRHTCGCTAGGLKSAWLHPGESITVPIIIVRGKLSGPYSKHLYVRYRNKDDEREKSLRLTVNGRAVSLFDIQPDISVNLGRVPAGKEWRKTFRLHARSDSPELGTVSSPPGVDVFSTREDGGDTLLTVP